MPRLIDDIRAAGKFETPWFIPPVKQQAWAEYARRLGEILGAPDMPVLLIDNVADYYFRGTDQERWDLKRDFPNLAPPFDMFWMEHRMPQVIHSKEFGDTNVNKNLNGHTLKNGRVGALIYALKPEDVKGDGIPENVRWILWADLFIDYGLRDRYAQGPHGATFFAIDDKGALIERPWMQSYSAPEHNEIMKSYITWFYPSLLAISFLHCKNVLIQDESVAKPLAKKYHARTGAWPVKYKTLVIEPLKTDPPHARPQRDSRHPTRDAHLPGPLRRLHRGSRIVRQIPRQVLDPVERARHAARQGEAAGPGDRGESMSETFTRPELTPAPERIRFLPVDKRGYPIPWFVDYLNGEPEFRAMDPAKWKRAIKERLCWVCGGKLGSYLAFTIGPMCVINRTTAEPPSHLECARWSCMNCPFIARPHMRRREDEIINNSAPVAGGIMIARNPGAMAIWITRSYRVWSPAKGEALIALGDPHSIEWYAEGRAATREEVAESVRTGLPFLEEVARKQRGGMEALAEHIKKAEGYWPVEVKR